MTTDTGTETTAGQATSFEAAPGSTVAPDGATTGDDDNQGVELTADQVLDAGLKDDPEIKQWVEKAGFKSVADLARNARVTQSEFNKRQGLPEGVPGADADPEHLAKFYDTVGRPAEPAGYEFAVPEGTPDDFPYDSNAAESFKQAAHANGLRPEQAAGLHDWFVQQQAEVFTQTQGEAADKTEADQQAQAKMLRNATAELEKAFDAPAGSETFNSHLEYAQRFFRENGHNELTEEMLRIGALVEGPDGSRQIASPRLFAAFAEAGRLLYAEGGRHDGDRGFLDRDNPWKEGKTFNVTRQHLIKSKDPARAARLQAAAGYKSK